MGEFWEYPIAIKIKNIPKEKRICSKCGRTITGRGDTHVNAPNKGKYCCHKCELL